MKLDPNREDSSKTMVSITGMENGAAIGNYILNGEPITDKAFNQVLKESHYQWHKWGVTILFNSTIDTVKFDLLFQRREDDG